MLARHEQGAGFIAQGMARASGKPAVCFATLARALSAPGPCLIHAPIDAQEKVYPMVPPGAANKDMIGGEAYVIARA